MRRLLIVSSAAVMIAATGCAAATSTDDGLGDGDETTAESTVATVRRGDLTHTVEKVGEVSYGDAWALPTDARGVITAGRSPGELVGFGEVLIRVDDRPITLAEGTMPMYRELFRAGTWRRDEYGNRIGLQSGADVEQLQRFLLSEGFDDDGRLTVDGEFGPTTERAVRAWQKAVGLPVSGRVDTTQLIIAGEPVRIADAQRVGNVFAELTVTTPEARVNVDLASSDRLTFAPGSTVEIVLPDDEIVAGVVTEQIRTTDADGSVNWATTIATDRSLPPDGDLVTVAATEVLADDALLVPVAALVALAERGFAVERAGTSSTTLIAVEVGAVVDGWAEIVGELDAGDEVVVAT